MDSSTPSLLSKDKIKNERSRLPAYVEPVTLPDTAASVENPDEAGSGSFSAPLPIKKPLSEAQLLQRKAASRVAAMKRNAEKQRKIDLDAELKAQGNQTSIVKSYQAPTPQSTVPQGPSAPAFSNDVYYNLKPEPLKPVFSTETFKPYSYY